MVWRVLTRDHLEATKKEFESGGYVMQWYAMASEVILTTLGPDWWKRNCVTGAEKTDEFLALPDDESGRYDRQDRIIRLGDMLYALRSDAGYEAFITSLMNRELAPAFFELKVANLLRVNGFVMEFVQTTGKMGQDYDLRASISGTKVFVEAKTRRDGTVLGRAALDNTLGKARKQLPATGPGLVFVSIPTEWTVQHGAEELVAGSIESFLQNTTRVNSVVLIWHQWMERGAGRASASLVKQYDNRRPRVPLSFGRIIKPLELSAVVDPSGQNFVPSFW
jgi:hypothetical protein